MPAGAAHRPDQHHQHRQLRRRAVLHRPRGATMCCSTSIATSRIAATQGSGPGPTGSPTPGSATMRRAPGPRTGWPSRSPRAGKGDRVARSYIGRLALQRVMSENGIDAFVHPENTVPTPKIQGPNVGQISLEGITPFFQIPRVVVPAGMTDVVIEPRYSLNATKTDYIATSRRTRRRPSCRTRCRSRSRSLPGRAEEPTLIKIGTAYEAATHHRTPPPAFGPTGAQPVRTTSSR